MEVTTLDTGWEIFNTSLSSLLSNVTTAPLEAMNNSSWSNTTDDVDFSNFTTEVFANFTTDPFNNATTTRIPWYRTKCGELYQFILRGFVLGCIVAFGVVGNVLSILVMRHDIHTSATSLLFFVLAIVDITVLATRGIVVCIPEWLDYWEMTSYTYRRFHKNYVDRFGQAFAYLAQHWTTGKNVNTNIQSFSGEDL